MPRVALACRQPRTDHHGIDMDIDASTVNNWPSLGSSPYRAEDRDRFAEPRRVFMIDTARLATAFSAGLPDWVLPFVAAYHRWSQNAESPAT